VVGEDGITLSLEDVRVHLVDRDRVARKSGICHGKVERCVLSDSDESTQEMTHPDPVALKLHDVTRK
jgi:hypothetical protein